MCIICNMRDLDGVLAASAFLTSFQKAAVNMKNAERDLLAVAAHAGPADARRYRQVQKRMAKIRREWNCIEHEREGPAILKETP